MSTIEHAIRNFDLLVAEFEALKQMDISESDTRSKVIDKILKDVLNWNEQDISREGHVDHGYYDYKITLPGIHIIVEAKKQFAEFKLPLYHKTATLNSLLLGNKDVITQIREYASDSGVPNGIVTNGKQFIIGKFLNIDGSNWKTNKCLIYNGFEDIRERFIEFYNNLERNTIIQNGGFLFSISPLTHDFNKVISSLTERDDELIRNKLSTRLTPIIDKIFGEIFLEEVEDDDEFIKECFVETLETKKNKDEIEKLFDDNAPSLHEVNPTKNTDNIAASISQEIESYDISIKEAYPPKPIIIVGSKGAGKTTFINYLFKKKLDSDILKNFPYIYIDFRKYFDHENSYDVKRITNDILVSIYEKYPELELHSNSVLKRIYFKEIKLNNESVWEEFIKNDPENYRKKLSSFLEEQIRDSSKHLEMLSKYLIRDRRIRLIIIIDNADQFDQKIQEDVFLFSNSLSRRSHCGIFVALREGYYYKWRNSPPFDAFESNVYHVTVPRYSEILQKRINYTLIKIDEKTNKSKPLNDEIRQEYQRVIEFLSSIKNSVFDSSNSEIIDFLSRTTFPNIREGLKVFKTFLTSGHTNVQEYIERELFKVSEKQITIPIHEFVKAIGLNNKLYYNHEHSLIKNIFYPVEGSSDHFIKSRILKYLSNKLLKEGGNNKLEQYSILTQAFVNFGYNINIIQKEIIELLKFGMLESENIISDTEWEKLPGEDFNICISLKGFYYYSNTKNRFYYLDLILQDIPIFDSSSFAELIKVFPKPDEKGKRFLFDRRNAVNLFIKYLEKQELNQSKEVLTNFGSIVLEMRNSGLNQDFAIIDSLLEKGNKFQY
jgi:GTPase SAR1 family protein